MMNQTCEEALARIPPEERVLLLPHCLRPSQTCPGRYTKQGLICPDDCAETCSIGTLCQAAIALHYKGICVAPGGAMALRFVKEMKPRGVVAVACAKELEMGIRGVESAAQDDLPEMPVVVVVPIIQDGCVDTTVDVDQALQMVTTVEERPGHLELPLPLAVPEPVWRTG